MKIKLLYFSWLRERIGVAVEHVDTNAETINDLIAELISKEEGYGLAFNDISVVKAAADQVLVDLNFPLKEVKEVAFFPPMTGG